MKFWKVLAAGLGALGLALSTGHAHEGSGDSGAGMSAATSVSDASIAAGADGLTEPEGAGAYHNPGGFSDIVVGATLGRIGDPVLDETANPIGRFAGIAKESQTGKLVALIEPVSPDDQSPLETVPFDALRFETESTVVLPQRAVAELDPFDPQRYEVLSQPEDLERLRIAS